MGLLLLIGLSANGGNPNRTLPLNHKEWLLFLNNTIIFIQTLATITVRVQAPLNISLYNLNDNPGIYSDYHIKTHVYITCIIFF